MPRTADSQKMCSLGKKVTELLKEKGISQKELAKRIYLNPIYFNQILYGKYPVQMRVIIAVAKELNVDALTLVAEALDETK